VRKGSLAPGYAEAPARLPRCRSAFLIWDYALSRAPWWRRDGAALAHAVDLLFTEPELFEISSLCSPISGARLQHFRDACI